MKSNVNHPAHYNSDPSGVECLDIVRHRNFNVGNAIKYLWRAGLKDEAKVIEDLSKAAFYIEDEIMRLGGRVDDPDTAVETETEEVTVEAPVKEDGIYLLYAGRYVRYKHGKDYDREGVKYIGVVFGGHSFAVSLTETNNVVLKPEDVKAAKRDNYLSRECDAIYDFEDSKNTANLLIDNPDLTDVIGDGESIPALGTLNIIAHLRADINKALEYVGGELLTDSDYWSSTEYSQTGAWLVYFGNGGTWYNIKYTALAVRAVAAF